MLALWSWRLPAAELGLILACYLLYLLTRGVGFSLPDQAGLENAKRVVSLEETLGVFWEPSWQTWVLEHALHVAVALNWVYIITYWPIVLGIGLAMFIRRRSLFYYYRTVIVVSLAIALLVFALFPVASPFKFTVDLVDTMQAYGPSWYASPEMAVYYNTNAAMPSLHFCWTVIIGVLFFRHLNGWLRLFGPIYPVLTFLAIIITGNHFILDAAAGGLLAGLSFAVVELGLGRRFNMSG